MNDNDADSAPETPATHQWESEGGSLTSRQEPLPEGILAVSVTHYRVGKYSYTNLEDAMAEYRRHLGDAIESQEAFAGTPV